MPNNLLEKSATISEIKKEEEKEAVIITPTPAAAHTPSQPAPKAITVEVDLSQKPASLKETINLLDDEEVNKDVTSKTEGDIKKEEAKKSSIDADEFRKKMGQTETPASDSSKNNVTQQQAEAWVKIADMIVIFGLKLYSGQADNTGFVVPESDKKVLAQQLAIALGEYKIQVPILVTLLTTFGAMYMGPFMNAKESKKKIEEFRAKKKKDEALNIKIKPELDPSTGKHQKKKGGQFKA